MKSIVFLLLGLAMIFVPDVLAQQNSNQARLKAIPAEIDKAVKVEDYQKAAALKREKGLREEMKEAVNEGNYERAASLKRELDNGGGASGQIAQLEREQKVAINNEEYRKAAALQEKIDMLKNGGKVASSEPTRPSRVSSSGSTTNSSFSGVDPEFVNQVYFLSSNGSLHRLEKKEGTLSTSAGGWGGFSSATSSYVIPGPRSPIRIKSNQLNFVVETYAGVDPSDQFKLNRLDVRGKNNPSRFADAYKSSTAVYHSETAKVSENNVAISFESIGENIYKIVIEDQMKPGEYAFMYIKKMFAFGIDQ